MDRVESGHKYKDGPTFEGDYGQNQMDSFDKRNDGAFKQMIGQNNLQHEQPAYSEADPSMIEEISQVIDTQRSDQIHQID